MSPVLRKTLKIVGYPVTTLVGAVALYYGVAQVLSRIPVAAEPTTEAATVPFFIRSNGVHTDLVMPVKSSFIDWSHQLPYSNTQAHDATYEYVGVGWGDKGFYLDTPTWAELKPSTAVRAGFWLSSTLMHATFYRASDLACRCTSRRPSTASLSPTLRTAFSATPPAISTGCRAIATPTTMPSTRPIAATASSIPATPGLTAA
jgi:hypothetical protein